jgi:lysophospholipase L1-like esterase
MMPGPDFEYSNLSGRPPGPVLRALSHLLRGVRDVQNQVEPYAARWGQANLSALAADGPLWVALGDSMTQGVGASDYDRGWVGQLQTSGGSEIPGRLINLASSGARVGDVLDRQLPALAALGRRPELVTVLIGSNDLIRPRHRKAFPAAFGRLLAELPRGSVVATLPNPSRAAAMANALLAAAVRDSGLVIAELRGPRTSGWKGKLAADHFHPNDLGYAGIAAVFAEALAARDSADPERGRHNDQQTQRDRGDCGPSQSKM